MSRRRIIYVMGVVCCCVQLFGGAPATASTRQDCFTDFAANEVPVRADFNPDICIPPLSGELYTIETTDNRSTIDGCLIDGHIPSGYTQIPRFLGTCEGGSTVTWFLNQAPLNRAFGVQTPVNTPASGSAATTDPDGDSLAYTITSTSEQGGVLSVNASSGAFTYTPPQFFEGDDFAAAHANDGKGGDADIQIFITVGTPSGENRPPAFPTFSTETKQDQEVGILLSAFDPDGDPVTIALDPSQPPTHGTLTSLPVTNAFLYTPSSGFFGDDAFGAIATDSHGNSTGAVFPIAVLQDPPPVDVTRFLPAILNLLLDD